MNFCSQFVFVRFPKRYERPIVEEMEQPIEEIVEEKKGTDDEKVSSRALKQVVNEILSNRPQPESAVKLLENLLSLYSDKKPAVGFCKVVYMIETKTAEWPMKKRKDFLCWYYSQLHKIIQQNVNIQT